jgi:hypothetical protein
MQERTTDTSVISEEEDASPGRTPSTGGDDRTTAGFGVGQGADADAGSGGALHETGVGWDEESDSVEHESARG